jgi:hypothetical protein
MKRDMLNNIHPITVLAPSAGPSDTTAQVCAIVDGQNHDGVTYVISTGSIADADATFTVLLEDGDAADLSDHAGVADQYLVGTEALAGFRFSDDTKAFKLGYIGNKRYTRMTITPVGNASAAAMGVVAILGYPHIQPTLNPPA